MENTSLNRTAVGFGYSFVIVNLLSAVLVVAKERYEPLMGWMKALTGHHWITHALFTVAGFVALGLVLSYAREWKATGRVVTTAMVFSTIAGGVILAGLFLPE